MRVLVTGANGYLGRKVVNILKRKEIELITTDLNDNIYNDRNFISSDIFKIENPFDFFGRPNVLIHMAWRDGFDHKNDSHMLDLSTHYYFLDDFINNNIDSISIMGSMHELGSFEGKVNNESPTNPLNLYAISKDTLRKAIEIKCTNRKTKLKWLRAYYIYGDDAHSKSIFGKIFSNEKNNIDYIDVNDGLGQYDFIHVDKLAYQITEASLQSDYEGIIECCSGSPFQLKKMIDNYIYFNNFNIKPNYGKLQYRPYDSKFIYGDSTIINDIVNKSRLLKIVVTGAKGQLGKELIKLLNEYNFTNVIGVDYSDLDITNELEVDKFFNINIPDIIFHCAAYTEVDKAEIDSNSCYNTNHIGTKYIVKNAMKYGAKIVYISTDYVFDGTKEFEYMTFDETNPVSIYGKSKLLGEQEVQMHNMFYIIRTSWVFGGSNTNFVEKIIKLAEGNKVISVVNDQIGSPTYALDLAKMVIKIGLSNKYGIYHVTNSEYCSWFEFAQTTLEFLKLNCLIKPVASDYFLTKAKRPKNSRLNNDSIKTFGKMPTWKDALKRYLSQYHPNKER